MSRTLMLIVALATGATHAAPAAPPPTDELRLFVEVMERIRSDYVEPVPDEVLIQNAIRGMLRGLDPHSDYLDQDGWSQVEALTTGRYQGLGLEVTVEDGVLTVIAPIDGGPAKAAGVKPGDVILRIDDTVAQTLDGVEAIRMLRGPAGTRVRLQLAREGVDQPITVTLVREDIELHTAYGRLFDGRFAYLRLSVFNENTPADAAAELERLATDADALHGLILDLRSNPGGTLESAVGVADLFLDEGLIVRASGRTPTARYERRASAGDVVAGRPIVVLIDGGSASGSEIVAGALQDHRRATVMGEQSFGKGLVQSVLAIDGTRGIKLTTARYFTPSGRSIDTVGITPDVQVDAAPADTPEGDAAVQAALASLRGPG